MTHLRTTTTFVISATLFALYSVTPVLADTYKILHTFKKTDGQGPKASMIFDASGKLYSTTFGGGANNNGTVFQMTHQKDGDWSESVLYSFTGGTDGSWPTTTLMFDSKGNLYGTTSAGGDSNADGVVFKLTKAGGQWKESVVHQFGKGSDGRNPYYGLVSDKAGHLFGTTAIGGGSGQGVVFQITP